MRNEKSPRPAFVAAIAARTDGAGANERRDDMTDRPAQPTEYPLKLGMQLPAPAQLRHAVDQNDRRLLYAHELPPFHTSAFRVITSLHSRPVQAKATPSGSSRPPAVDAKRTRSGSAPMS